MVGDALVPRRRGACRMARRAAAIRVAAPRSLPRAGAPLALRHRCPLVSYVHAPQVWEAAQWGVRRPGWGRLVERYGERPQLVASDVVAVVSDEVAAQVARLGVDERRILVSPMAVDARAIRPRNGRCRHSSAVRPRRRIRGRMDRQLPQISRVGDCGRRVRSAPPKRTGQPTAARRRRRGARTTRAADPFARRRGRCRVHRRGRARGAARVLDGHGRLRRDRSVRRAVPLFAAQDA